MANINVGITRIKESLIDSGVLLVALVANGLSDIGIYIGKF